MTGRHMFAGVNTPCGFYSRFDSIMEENTKNRKIFIKGGPGTGKSTLMKKICERADKEKFDFEVFHCSADSDSLDGVYIPDLNTAIIDSTAPHNCDPVYPGIGGEIFNVGDCIKTEILRENAEATEFFTMKKQRAYKKGFEFLSAALPLIENMISEYEASADIRGIYDESEKLISRLLGYSKEKGTGKCRELFMSAITGDGYVNFADTVFKGSYLISIKGAYGAHVILRRLAEACISKGLDITKFYCPMQPDCKEEHLIIPDLGVCLTTYDYYVHVTGDEVIDLDGYISFNPSSGNIQDFNDTLIGKAIDCFQDAKVSHRFIESFYIPAMDFDTIEARSEKLIESIFN